ncbi:MAG: magnesium transporter [Emcibacteraceae bacterium]|uniref:magnesium transporter n=1 Tax=Pseudemcibacter sp. TaxID=2943293 RepID=UPI003F69F0F4|nr:magnesium transporter [Emcibacteraceae bacterium]MDG1725574.1 magnesium transporter [Emcibacteraceae bacterium]
MNVSNENNLSDNESMLDEVLPVSPELVDEIIHALEKGDKEQIDFLLEPLHNADIADVFEQLSDHHRRILTSVIGSEMEPEVLSELDDSTLDDVIAEMDDQDVARAISQMESDDAVHVLEDLDQEEQRKIIDALSYEDRIAIEEGLSYPEDSAGRLLQKNLVSVPGQWSVGKVIDYFKTDKELPNEFYEVFIVDPMHHPIGTVALNKIIRSDRDILISEIMEEELKLVPVEMDQEEVAYLFRHYDLTSMAVVDDSGRLIGMITVDDVVDVIDEEAEEDLMLLSGIADTDITESVIEASKNRVIWLIINLATAILASMVIALFDATIEQMVALAVLMPIVASMGGNAGTQTMTVTVRALATRELTTSNAKRIIFREFSIALLNGIIIAVLIGGLSWAWFNSSALGGVMAVAMIINMIMAGLAGILIPIGLDKINIDPALASSIFVTTITDVIGFFAFLGLAAVVLI